jgi:hypothetical protein
MLSDSRFWFGVVAGLAGLYVYHRIKGVPSNAPGSNKSA